MKKLNVNIDHVATLRQARLGTYPDPIEIAQLVEKTKASGVVMHLREDRRHIQDYDLKNYKKIIKIPLNLEIAPTNEMISIANRIEPNMVTLVPEKRKELTTEGGLDIVSNFKKLQKLINILNKKIKVMLFIDPKIKIIDRCYQLGVHGIEINTGKYCEAKKKSIAKEIENIKKGSRYAEELGLYVAAGHGLNTNNIGNIAKIKYIKEYNIGHSIISDSISLGIVKSTNRIYNIINKK